MPTPPSPPRADPADLAAWAVAAPIGARRVYFTGNGDAPGPVARAAMALYHDGLALPFQRRLGPNRFAYELVRVSPRAARVFGKKHERDILRCGRVETNRFQGKRAPGAIFAQTTMRHEKKDAA